MKKLLIVGAVAAVVALSAGTSQAQLAFSSTAGSGNNITFAGSSFTFNGTFGVNTTAGVVLGSFGNGPFSIGSITTIGSEQVANVSGLASLSIGGLTGTVNWVQIFSLGTSVGFNDGGVINLSNLSYSGSNADLQKLAATPNGTLTLDLTFTPAMSLSSIVAASSVTTTYSGTMAGVAPVPEASTIVAGALMLLPLGIGAVRSLRKERIA